MKKSSTTNTVISFLFAAGLIAALAFIMIDVFATQGVGKIVSEGDEYYIMNISEDGKLRLVVYGDHEYLFYKDGLTHSRDCGCFLPSVEFKDSGKNWPYGP